MEIKTYKTGDKHYPWRAEASDGNFVDAVTKEAAINMLKSFYDERPKTQQNNIANERVWQSAFNGYQTLLDITNVKIKYP